MLTALGNINLILQRGSKGASPLPNLIFSVTASLTLPVRLLTGVVREVSSCHLTLRVFKPISQMLEMRIFVLDKGLLFAVSPETPIRQTC